jgi:hypothetical protein
VRQAMDTRRMMQKEDIASQDGHQSCSFRQRRCSFGNYEDAKRTEERDAAIREVELLKRKIAEFENDKTAKVNCSIFLCECAVSDPSRLLLQGNARPSRSRNRLPRTTSLCATSS